VRRPLGLLIAGLVLTGCGAATSTQTDQDVTLLLGGPPTAQDAGIYLAIERGFDEAEGVRLEIRRSGDPVTLLRGGRVQAALMDVAQARSAHAICVMALRQAPQPGPYVCVQQTAIEDDPATVAAIVSAIQRGYGEATADPESAVQAIVTRAPGIDYQKTLAELNTITPSFAAGAPFIGWLNRNAITPGDRSLFDFSVAKPFGRD
jgi:ABC-type nitrate/sulfonate/bicarbonate transport system substrate-binding protein